MDNMNEQPQTQDNLRRISASSFEESMQYVDDSNIRSKLREYLYRHAALNNDERHDLTEILRQIISKDYMTTLSIIAECEPPVAAIVESPDKSVPPTKNCGVSTINRSELISEAENLIEKLKDSDYSDTEQVLNEAMAYNAVAHRKLNRDLLSGNVSKDEYLAEVAAIDKLTSSLTKKMGLVKILKQQNDISLQLVELQTDKERGLDVL